MTFIKKKQIEILNLESAVTERKNPYEGFHSRFEQKKEPVNLNAEQFDIQSEEGKKKFSIANIISFPICTIYSFLYFHTSI